MKPKLGCIFRRAKKGKLSGLDPQFLAKLFNSVEFLISLQSLNLALGIILIAVCGVKVLERMVAIGKHLPLSFDVNLI